MNFRPSNVHSLTIQIGLNAQRMKRPEKNNHKENFLEICCKIISYMLTLRIYDTEILTALFDYFNSNISAKSITKKLLIYYNKEY